MRFSDRSPSRFAPPLAPVYPERDAARVSLSISRGEIKDATTVEWGLAGFGCDGRHSISALGSAACAGAVPGQQLVLTQRYHGNPSLITTRIPRALSGTQGSNVVSVGFAAGAFAIASSMRDRRRFIDTDGNLYGPTGASLGSAPAYFKAVSYHVAITSSHTAGVSTGEVVSFTAAASGGTAPYSYVWDWDDGSTDTGASVSHAWTAVGFYVPTVTATDSAGTPVTAAVAFYAHVVEPPPASSATAGAIVIPPRRNSYYTDTGGDPWGYTLGEDSYGVYNGTTGYEIGTGSSGRSGWDTEGFGYAGVVTKNCLTPGLYAGQARDGFTKSNLVVFGLEVEQPIVASNAVFYAVARSTNIAVTTPLATLLVTPAKYKTLPIHEKNLCASADGSWWAQHGHRGGVFGNDALGYELTNYLWNGSSVIKGETVNLAHSGTWAGTARVWQEFARLT